MLEPAVRTPKIEAPHVLRARPLSFEATARRVIETVEDNHRRLPDGVKAAGRPVIVGALAALVLGFVVDVGPWNTLAGRLLGTADAQEAQSILADGAAPSEADRAALRYFAREGDVERLEAELRRLRALYPGWNPPRDLLDAQGEDVELQRVYALVGDQRYDEARAAIAERQQRDPTYEPPDRLVALLQLAAVRSELREASEASNYAEVLRIAEANEGILTCEDVDSIWRVAEAFAQTGRPQRAYDAYAYVITTCTDEDPQAGSLQKAADILTPQQVLQLFTLKGVDIGTGTFGQAALDIIRGAVALAGQDEAYVVPQEYVDLLAEYARTGTNLEDAMLVGYYLYRNGFASEAALWFRFALDNGLGADAAEGYVLALRATGNREDAFLAREVAYEWREQTPELMTIYLEAVASLLTADQLGELSVDDTTQLAVERYVPVVIQQRDANGAQALGWYAFNTCQFIIAEEWFITSANWVPSEVAIFGLALTRLRIGDLEGFEEVVDEWAPLYESVRLLKQGQVEELDVTTVRSPDDPTNELGLTAPQGVICDPEERRKLMEMIADRESEVFITEAGSLTAGIPVRALGRRPDGSTRPDIPRRPVVIQPRPADQQRSLITRVQAAVPPLPTPTQPTIAPSAGAAVVTPPQPQPQAGRIIPAPASQRPAGGETLVRQRAIQGERRAQPSQGTVRLRNGQPARPVARRTAVVTGGNRALDTGGATVQRRVRRDAKLGPVDARVREIVGGPTGGGGSPGGSAAQRALSAGNYSRCVAVTDGAIRRGTLSSEDASARGFCLLNLQRPVEASQAFQLAQIARASSRNARTDAVYGSTLAALARNMTSEAAVEATKAPLNRGQRTDVQIQILTQRALAANRDGRYTEALFFLDQRSRIAPLSKDLMLLQGYAYLNAGDRDSAHRIFTAINQVGGTGDSAAALYVYNQRFLPPSLRSRYGD